MILSPADFPLTDDIAALESAIAQTEILIQGHLGANRSLTVTDYIEVHPLRMAIYPQIKPIVAIADIWMMGGVTSSYGIVSNSSRWAELASTNYEFDAEYGEVRIWGVQEGSRRSPASIKIKYSAGFDFDSNSSVVQEIKAAAIAIASELLNPVVANNVKSFEIDDEGHKTTYFGASEGINLTSSNTKIGALLATFHKYRPEGERFA